MPPFQGSGQVNGAIDAVWVAISNVLINLLREEGYAAHFISTITNKLTELVGFAFVDNIGLIHISTDLKVALF